jgi:hypothetical protein
MQLDGCLVYLQETDVPSGSSRLVSNQTCAVRDAELRDVDLPNAQSDFTSLNSLLWNDVMSFDHVRGHWARGFTLIRPNTKLDRTKIFVFLEFFLVA